MSELIGAAMLAGGLLALAVFAVWDRLRDRTVDDTVEDFIDDSICEASELTAKAALTPDCDQLPGRPRPLWEIERYDDMTDDERLAEIGWLRELVGNIPDPPVIPGRNDQ